jgi:hypothetical protein
VPNLSFFKIIPASVLLTNIRVAGHYVGQRFMADAKKEEDMLVSLSPLL